MRIVQFYIFLYFVFDSLCGHNGAPATNQVPKLPPANSTPTDYAGQQTYIGYGMQQELTLMDLSKNGVPYPSKATKNSEFLRRVAHPGATITGLMPDGSSVTIHSIDLHARPETMIVKNNKEEAKQLTILDITQDGFIDGQVDGGPIMSGQIIAVREVGPSAPFSAANMLHDATAAISNGLI